MRQSVEQVKAQAESWVAANPDMWRVFQEKAVRSSSDNREWSARGIAEALRWDGEFQRAYGSQFKIPNAITPVLGRMICEEHPQTAAWFRHSHSKVDAK